MAACASFKAVGVGDEVRDPRVLKVAPPALPSYLPDAHVLDGVPVRESLAHVPEGCVDLREVRGTWLQAGLPMRYLAAWSGVQGRYVGRRVHCC